MSIQSHVLAPWLGRGWMDQYEPADGLCIGRMCCRPCQPLEYEQCAPVDSMRICLQLDGYSVIMPAGQSLGVAAGDILLRHAGAGSFRSRAHSGSATRKLARIALDIPTTMAGALHADSLTARRPGRTVTCTVLRPNASAAAKLRRLGQQMLQLHTAQPLAALALESLSLDLLQTVVAATDGWRAPVPRPLSHHARLALDRTVDILHSEWDQPLSIATLAHRTGLNACYLKRFFRERFGQGIVTYLRRLRMQQAFDLLVSKQYSVQQVALVCGYLHAGKFAQAFRRAFGLAPSMV